MFILEIIGVIILIMFIAVCNYTHNSNIGAGIIFRLMAALTLAFLVSIITIRIQVTPTEKIYQINKRIYACNMHQPPEQNCTGTITVKVY